MRMCVVCLTHTVSGIHMLAAVQAPPGVGGLGHDADDALRPTAGSWAGTDTEASVCHKHWTIGISSGLESEAWVREHCGPAAQVQ